MAAPTTARERRRDLLGEAISREADRIRARIGGPQRSVATMADTAVLGLLSRLERLDSDRPWAERIATLAADPTLELKPALQLLLLLLTRAELGRFADYERRVERRGPAGLHGARDVPRLDVILSQGLRGSMRWKGQPLFKTAYDFSLYSMLMWDLKPRTVVEVGSGCGTSAIWLADLGAAFGLDLHVYSIDRKPPVVQHEAVTFLLGDCAQISAAMPPELLEGAPHPWLIVEDAHVNVLGVLRHFDAHTRRGDYVIVEDSLDKRDAISAFLQERPSTYAVDTYYTDFFGRNATCACDSILVRTSDGASQR